EANFFVRDVTGGSRLPFRIRPGAPTSSIDVSASGNVGMNNASPSRSLDISRAGVVDIGLQNTSGTSVRWFLQTDNDTNHTFKLSREGGGGTVVTVDARQDANGVTFKVDGSIQATNVVFSSSRELKTEIAPLDGRQILARLDTLPIAEWQFKAEKNPVRHIGPMAEDFQQVFGVGTDNKHISATDANGIALAAIQGLHAQLKDRDQEIAELRTRIEALERLLQPQAKSPGQ
ncbi:MAG TPA: tail fiber domain-containing protein, partial [Thermoanaerobaculia bacterium]|nr:tail fiber domain-containing protein [Thermoanaerobaculia bacterium]